MLNSLNMHSTSFQQNSRLNNIQSGPNGGDAHFLTMTSTHRSTAIIPVHQQAVKESAR
jgi:hypothetical protein